jgi:ATP-dependent Clp protease protease subunit
VLEPKDGRSVGKDWEELGSEIGNLPLLADDEQPLPTNVMYPGTSEFWRNDDYEE